MRTLAGGMPLEREETTMRTLGFRQEIRNQSTARGTERWASGCRLSISVTLWTVAHLRDRQGFWARLYGADLRVFFSQVFLKPPESGGPKPVHQDNFYFGPADRDRVLECLLCGLPSTRRRRRTAVCSFVDGSHREAVLPHVAPPLEYDPSVIIRVSEAYDRFMVFAVQTIGYLRLSVFPCTSR